MSETTQRNCKQCKFCILQDTGYSNYTVEGTDFMCGKNLHPDAPFDRWYGEDKRLAFAEKCDGFVEGSPISMDVEEEGKSDLDAEQLRIFNGEFRQERA